MSPTKKAKMLRTAVMRQFHTLGILDAAELVGARIASLGDRIQRGARRRLNKYASPAESVGLTPAESVGLTRSPREHLALVVGPFSFDSYKCTFGDTEVLKVVLAWLEELGVNHDVCWAKSNGGPGIPLSAFDPARYTMVVYACGPFTRTNSMLAPFGHCARIGVSISIEEGTPHSFDLLLARDSPQEQNPDLAFVTRSPNAPLLGIALVHPQPEYGIRQRHDRTREVVDEFLQASPYAHVPLDTLYLDNPTGVQSAVAFEGLVQRLDLVISSRMHGLVFALKNGIPAIAVDPIAGGAKVSAQARALGWPVVFNGDGVSPDDLANAAARCLRGDFAPLMPEIRRNAESKVSNMKERFFDFVERTRPTN